MPYANALNKPEHQQHERRENPAEISSLWKIQAQKM